MLLCGCFCFYFFLYLLGWYSLFITFSYFALSSSANSWIFGLALLQEKTTILAGSIISIWSVRNFRLQPVSSQSMIPILSQVLPPPFLLIFMYETPIFVSVSMFVSVSLISSTICVMQLKYLVCADFSIRFRLSP